jgi:putative Holliday junction resolvase
MPHILGIDHGTVRIGLALSDELAIVASPLKTLDSGPGVEREIARIVRQKRVSEVVLGMPYRMSGERGSAAARVEKFAERLRKALPEDVRVVFADERLSSKVARESLGFTRRPQDREEKKLVDQVAAVAILQDHLNTRQGPEAWLLPEEE